MPGVCPEAATGLSLTYLFCASGKIIRFRRGMWRRGREQSGKVQCAERRPVPPRLWFPSGAAGAHLCLCAAHAACPRTPVLRESRSLCFGRAVQLDYRDLVPVKTEP